MKIEHLVKLANNIAAFFESEPDIAKAQKGVADHIRNFWDPRMRRQMMSRLDEPGTGLSKLAHDALVTYRKELTPADKAPSPFPSAGA